MVVILISSEIQRSSSFHMKDSDKIRFVSFLESILRNHFTPGRTLLVWMLGFQEEQVLFTPSRTISDVNNIMLEDQLMEALHENYNWPMEILVSGTKDEKLILESITSGIEGCIFFLNYRNIVHMRNYLNDSLPSILTLTLINKFIVFPIEFGYASGGKLATTFFFSTFDLISVNSTILIPNVKKNTTSVDIYTMFPYGSKHGWSLRMSFKPQWKLEKSTHKDFFTTKLQSNFNGCPLQIFSMGVAPYVILKGNKTLDNGKVMYQVEGISIEYLTLFAEKFNFSLKFREPLITLNYNRMLQSGYGDFLSSHSPSFYVSVLTLRYTQNMYVNPYLYETAKYLVPCPKPLRRGDSLFKVFHLTVWLAIFITFFLVSLLFWSIGSGSVESINFKEISLCFYNAWSLFLGISTPVLPLTPKLRIVFIIYVCYSFCVNMVFQAYFVNYLVNPGYSKRLSTLEDVRDSRVPFSVSDSMNLFLTFTGNEEIQNRKYFTCIGDVTDCVKFLN